MLDGSDCLDYKAKKGGILMPMKVFPILEGLKKVL